MPVILQPPAQPPHLAALPVPETPPSLEDFQNVWLRRRKIEHSFAHGNPGVNIEHVRDVLTYETAMISCMSPDVATPAWAQQLVADIKEMRTDMNTGMDQIDARMGQIDTRMDQMNTRIGQMNTRMGHMNTRMDQIETRLGQLGDEVAQVKKHTTRMSKICAKAYNRTCLDGADIEFEEVPFLDGQYPSDEGFPLLVNFETIQGLSAETVTKYWRRYYGRRRLPSVDEQRTLIRQAIGCEYSQ
ncbi:hypothetical protein A0H81_12148 [Grifola frondosa]|uniref:Mug135-like C-terminal domain-containing protein n=1 Tax=Grifola frondosa TaxID=5627 RepID=A0A1C7LUP0_GRIFR|nr:hypothetical protein A0H81_12148 [Grifola frondosa]